MIHLLPQVVPACRGTVFGLISLADIWRAIEEGRRLDPPCRETIGVFSDNGLETALAEKYSLRL